MNSRTILGLIIVVAAAVSGSFAQELKITTTAANTVASKTKIDLPGLTGNPQAIIVATPVGNTATLNPHPIGAWYYNGQWNIHNTDHATMPVGLTFMVQVFLSRDATHFLHVVTLNDLHSFIDVPVLNNNPSAQVRIFQNHAPDSRPFDLNPNEAKVYYDNLSNRWYIINANNKHLRVNTAYNVVVSSPPAVGSTVIKPQPVTTGKSGGPNPSGQPPPSGAAGGDLNGNYPNPNVIGLNGRPLSGKVPAVGQLLRWSGTEWEPVTVASGVNSGNGEGQSGQVLTSNGAGSHPTWKQIPVSGPPAATQPPAIVKTSFKESTALVVAVPNKATRQFPDLSHSITITKRSRLAISAMITVFGATCTVCFQGSQGSLTVDINGARKFDLPVGLTPNQWSTFTIANFMIDLDPGTYNIVFGLVNDLSQEIGGRAKQSSVVIFPLE